MEASAIPDTLVPAAAEDEKKVQDLAEIPELPSSATEKRYEIILMSMTSLLIHYFPLTLNLKEMIKNVFVCK